MQKSDFRCWMRNGFAAIACLALLLAGGERAVAGTNDLAFHGGPTMQNQIKAYLIYWLPVGIILDTGARDGVGNFETLTQQFFDDVSATPYLNIDTEYPGTCGSQQCVLANRPLAVTRAGAWVDTRAYPEAGTQKNPLQDTDIQAEVTRAIKANKWVADANSEFFVFTGISKSGVPIEECLSKTQCSFNAFCAYHSNYTDNNGNSVLYAYMSDASFNTAGCNEGIATGPNGQLASDREVALMSHEFDETVTDPLANAWWNPASQAEIGDNCNQQPATVKLGARTYAVQKLYDNTTSACVSQFGPSIQFVISTSSEPLAKTSSATATLDTGAGGGQQFVALKAAGQPAWAANTANMVVTGFNQSVGVLGLDDITIQMASSASNATWSFSNIVVSVLNTTGEIVCQDSSVGNRSLTPGTMAAVSMQACSDTPSDVSIWKFTGPACTGGSCPGWEMIDDSPTVAAIAAEPTAVFKLYKNGLLYASKGQPCNGTSCPDWVEDDNVKSTTAITADGSKLSQLRGDSSIWTFIGPRCLGKVCNGWQQQGGGTDAVAIASDGTRLYQQEATGTITSYRGQPCSGGTCPAWLELDNNERVRTIAADAGALYKLYAEGAIYHYVGPACDGLKCDGWTELDDNPASLAIVASGKNLYQLHNDGSIWAYTGTPCTGTSCPGWRKLDDNPLSGAIAAGGGKLYQLHTDGSVWRYTGSACTGNSCPGWLEIDNNSRTVAIAASGANIYELHNNLLQ